jgi:hypothetical protein
MGAAKTVNADAERTAVSHELAKSLPSMKYESVRMSSTVYWVRLGG